MEDNDSEEFTAPLLSSSPSPSPSPSLPPLPAVEVALVSGKTHTRGLRDPAFLLLFLLHLFYIASLAISYGGVAMSSAGAAYWIVSSSGSTEGESEYSETIDERNVDVPAKLSAGLFFVLLVSASLSLCWIFFLSHIARFAMHVMILAIVIISSLSGVALLSMRYTYIGVLLLCLAIATLVVALLCQSRIEFAAQNLLVACEAIVAIPSTLRYSVLALCGQVLFVGVWCIAAFGFATNSFQVSKYYQGTVYTLDECTSYKYYSNIIIDDRALTCSSSSSPCYACLCGPSHEVVSADKECFKPRFYWPAFFFLVVSLFWTNAVIANLLHSTTAASVWRWWTRGECSERESGEDLRRMASDSLGSICFGSLLAALVRSIRSVLTLVQQGRSYRDRRREAHRNEDERWSFFGWSTTPLASVASNSLSAFALFCHTSGTVLSAVDRYAGWVLEYSVRFLDRVIVYFNRYAFCFVGIEGLDYMKAATAAVNLFRSRGLTALLNDDLIDSLLLLSSALIALLCMSFSFVFAKNLVLSQTYITLLALFGFFCGLVMSTVMLSTVSSAVTTVYVSFAKNPRVFEDTHPELFMPLANAWNNIYPNLQSTTNNALLDEDFGGEAPSTSAPIRGTYNPPSVDAVRAKKTPPTSAKTHAENTNNNTLASTSSDGEESRSRKKSVSWGVNAVLELVPSTIGFMSGVVSGARDSASAGVVTGSYQRLSTQAEDDGDELGQSSCFLGETPSADSFRL